MTQHSSLRSGQKRKRHRSVLKRFERIKVLKEKEEWKEGESLFGLPKVKTIRIKIKKEKAAEAPAEAVAEGAAPTPGTEAPEAPFAPTPGKEKIPAKKEKEK